MKYFCFIFLLSFGAWGYELQRVETDFDRPLFFLSAPEPIKKQFVLEKHGRLWSLQEGKPRTLYLDLSKKVATSSEEGLLGMALDPDFSKSGMFYVHYSNLGDRASVVSRFFERKGVADLSSEEVVIRIGQPRYTNHKGGMITFGPDKFLYIGLGDGGSAADPDNRSQDTQQLLGKILRIDVSQKVYQVPSDNPFASSGKCDFNGKPGNKSSHKCGEIFSYGIRNPWRFSFDGNDLWLADVGQDKIEEIDLVKKGDNLGWRYFEGSQEFRPEESMPPTVKPIYEYTHSEGQSVTGGYVYRGQKLKKLFGKYIFGDYVSGKIWALDPKTRKAEFLLESVLISSFGLDSRGEIIVVSIGGDIFRLL